MQTLSPLASAILDRMEPDRGYEPMDLRALAPDLSPDLSMERLREIMHELWVSRQVERFGYAGWRRCRSSSGIESGLQAPDVAPTPGSGPTKVVKPEDLFDHDAFAGLFK
jgi:hypothetical protein